MTEPMSFSPHGELENDTSTPPLYGPDNPEPGTRLWRFRNHPDTLTHEDAVQLCRDLDELRVAERARTADPASEYGRRMAENAPPSSLYRADMAARTADPGGLPDNVVAAMFHDTYERLAPTFGYETRRESAVPWGDVPLKNQMLMTAVVQEVRAALASETAAPGLDEWPDRSWLISHWVGHRCGYVDCRTTEQHEHGSGEPLREMTPEERAALHKQPDDPEAGS